MLGQISGMIKEEKTLKEIFENIMEESKIEFKRLKNLVGGDNA